MLTHDDLENVVNQLNLSDRLFLIELLVKSVKDEVTQSSSKSERGLSGKSKPDKKDLPPIEELVGMLNPDGLTYSDEDLDNIRYQYLAEKYGL